MNSESFGGYSLIIISCLLYSGVFYFMTRQWGELVQKDVCKEDRQTDRQTDRHVYIMNIDSQGRWSFISVNQPPAFKAFLSFSQCLLNAHILCLSLSPSLSFPILSLSTLSLPLSFSLSHSVSPFSLSWTCHLALSEHCAVTVMRLIMINATCKWSRRISHPATTTTMEIENMQTQTRVHVCRPSKVYSDGIKSFSVKWIREEMLWINYWECFYCKNHEHIIEFFVHHEVNISEWPTSRSVMAPISMYGNWWVITSAPPPI